MQPNMIWAERPLGQRHLLGVNEYLTLKCCMPPLGDDPEYWKAGPVTDPNHVKYRSAPGIGYQEHANVLKKLFSILKIDSQKLTHAFRGVAARRLRLMSGGNTSMVAGKGNWSKDGDNAVMGE